MAGIIVRSLGPNANQYIIPQTIVTGDILTTFNNAIDAQFLAAGWTVFDAPAGATYKVYRGTTPAGTKNFVQYNWGSNTFNVASQGCFMALYEDWNATTHVGTNLAYSSNTNMFFPNAGTVGFVSIGPYHVFNMFFSGDASQNVA